MATYSQELEDTLKDMTDSTETVLELCNTLRTNFKTRIREDVHFRNYHYDIIKVFEYISDMERAALWVIDGAEVIRRQNADLITTGE
ncbi:MAG: hypothetical protein IKP64_10320 [Selenomonadaceae bacterium]|nr:hypothetical protein [Selenomonadaceae bacterium]MBR4383939.1 hypothetical protein [Selenomonadaceae bacterium]